MRPWIKRTLIGVFGGAALFSGFAACAHRMHGPWSGNMTQAEQAQWRGRMVDRASRKLDLDSAQKAKLALLADTLSAQRKAIGVERNEGRNELKAVLAGSQFDRKRAQLLIDAKTSAVREASPAVITAAADFFDSLNTAQQQKVRAFLERGGRHGWHG